MSGRDRAAAMIRFDPPNSNYAKLRPGYTLSPEEHVETPSEDTLALQIAEVPEDVREAIRSGKAPLAEPANAPVGRGVSLSSDQHKADLQRLRAAQEDEARTQQEQAETKTKTQREKEESARREGRQAQGPTGATGPTGASGPGGEQRVPVGAAGGKSGGPASTRS